MFLRTIRVKKVAVMRDGGTTTYVDKLGNIYYEDHRIGTKTKGKFYNHYPGDEGAHGVVAKFEVVDEFFTGATLA